jgi:2,3-bisphosphoglycerate-independent phosphoglycerate mutase
VADVEIPFLFAQLIYDYKERSGHIEVLLDEVTDRTQTVLQQQEKFKLTVACVTQEFYRISGSARCMEMYDKRYQLQFALDTPLEKSSFALAELVKSYDMVAVEFAGSVVQGYIVNFSDDGNFLVLRDPDTLRIQLFPVGQCKITLLDSGIK